MATETVEVTLPGLTGFTTLTAKLYADGSDTLVDTIATLTEATNRLGTYTGTTATGATGLHLIAVLEGTTVRGEGYVNLRNSASGVTVAGSREGARLDVATIPSATLASTTNITSATGITVATNSDKTGYSLSSAGVQAIWDALTSALTTVGSIGKKLADAVFSSTGTGARTITVTVNDGATALENAKVRFTEGVNTFQALTNVSGQKVFNLDDATYTVAITKFGYTYAGGTLVVTGNATPTFSMTAVVIAPPASADVCNVVGTAYDETTTAESGAKVYAVMTAAPSGTGWIVDSKTVTATANGSGLITLPLLRLATYRIKRGDGPWVEGVVIPDASQVEIDNLLGVD